MSYVYFMYIMIYCNALSYTVVYQGIIDIILQLTITITMFHITMTSYLDILSIIYTICYHIMCIPYIFIIYINFTVLYTKKLEVKHVFWKYRVKPRKLERLDGPPSAGCCNVSKERVHHRSIHCQWQASIGKWWKWLSSDQVASRSFFQEFFCQTSASQTFWKLRNLSTEYWGSKRKLA